MSQLIAFAGDIHDNQEFVNHLLRSFHDRDPNAVVLLGDITAADTLRQFEDENVHLVFGNGDFPNVRDLARRAHLSEMRVHGQSGRVRFGRRLFVFRHGVEPREMSYALAAHCCDYVVHGHYHSVEDTTVGTGRVLSPGNEGVLYYDVDADSFEQVNFDVETEP